MAVNLSPVYGAGAQLFDNNGVPLAGGLIYTYAAGTTTPQATYTSSLGTVQQANPIILDASGRVPSGEIWLTDGLAYKFVVQTASAVSIASYDNLTGINSNFVAFTSQEETQTATQGQTVFTLTTMQYQPGTDNLLVFVNGSKQIVSQNYTETSSTVITFASGLNVGDVVDFTTAIPIASNATTAANVSYNEGQSGAITRTIQSKLQEIVSVLDFGADPTGATDSTTQIQDAINAVQGTETAIYIPSGTYLVNNGLTANNSISLYGAGKNSVILKWTSNTVNVLSIATDNPVIIEGITFQGPGNIVSTAFYGTSTAGAVILLTGNSVANKFSSIKNCHFIGGYNQFYTISAYGWVVDGNVFESYVNYGTYVSNTYQSDSGDSTIVNNFYTSPYSSPVGVVSVGIYQVSSGGLKIINNKILGGYHGYQLQKATTAITGDLLITANSIENSVDAAIMILSDNTTPGQFQNIVINGNQIWNCKFGVYANAHFNDITITGNTISFIPATNGIGIPLANVSSFNVTGNFISGNAGTSIGIYIDSSCGYGQVASNNIYGTSVQTTNNSTTTNVSVLDNNLNSLFGRNAFGASTGANNTGVGANAGSAVTTGNKLTIIGSYNGNSGGLDLRTANNYVALSDGDGYLLGWCQNGGSWYQKSNSASWATTSDIRIKENITPVTNGLDVILALKPVEFDYITTKQHMAGFVAQDYEKTLPDQVFEEKNASEDLKALTNGEPIKTIQPNLNPYLVDSIHKLNNEIEALKAKLGN